jgi:DNA-binding beta-propeller fold protein YncE
MRYLVALTAVIVVALPAVSRADRLYWTENANSGAGLIRNANLDGTDAQTVVTQVNQQNVPGMGNLVVDSVAGNMYWCDKATDQIYRSTLGGQHVQSIITLGPPTPFQGEGYGLAIDLIHQKLYYTDESHDNKIFRADLDGSNIHTVLSLPGQDPFALSLDLVHNKIYFSDGFTGKIERVNLDGSGSVDTLATGLGSAGLAVDPLGGKLYYTDTSANTVSRMNLDGTNPQALVSTGGFPWGIALDVTAGTMYWAEANGHQLASANLNGSNVQQVESITDSLPFGIAISNIPEPSSFILLMLGPIALLAIRRFQTRWR